MLKNEFPRVQGSTGALSSARGSEVLIAPAQAALNVTLDPPDSRPFPLD